MAIAMMPCGWAAVLPFARLHCLWPDGGKGRLVAAASWGWHSRAGSSGCQQQRRVPTDRRTVFVAA